MASPDPAASRARAARPPRGGVDAVARSYGVPPTPPEPALGRSARVVGVHRSLGAANPRRAIGLERESLGRANPAVGERGAPTGDGPGHPPAPYRDLDFVLAREMTEIDSEEEGGRFGPSVDTSGTLSTAGARAAERAVPSSWPRARTTPPPSTRPSSRADAPLPSSGRVVGPGSAVPVQRQNDEGVAGATDQTQTVDLDALAREIYGMIKERLRIERERAGLRRGLRGW